eukprot:CAMPEP_0205936700 /NCGR_PEP_ID=MMETSP1325-20131115/42212_1 /ASSEMBLY_ACC=CAM_ASM_000708 /TAXON_ID=236786 /ORGANISM="Florenciella sp., Strain RCC1007" /LENGTH=34 /DNA_ID= /DNA_START= /DNA_END= /DNA_ORIENTATION=
MGSVARTSPPCLLRRMNAAFAEARFNTRASASRV